MIDYMELNPAQQLGRLGSPPVKKLSKRFVFEPQGGDNRRALDPPKIFTEVVIIFLDTGHVFSVKHA